MAGEYVCGRKRGIRVASKIIMLIGMRASGKTTLGRALAARLEVEFLDLDDLVLARFPERTVREVWASRGEEAWRKAEAIALREALDRTEAGVLALGGGAPTVAAVADAIRSAVAARGAAVIYLKTDPITLAARLRRDEGDRPALTRSATPAEEVESILKQREAIYRTLATRIIECDGREVETIIDAIASEL